MTPEDQLALVHIGIILKHFMPDEHLPDDLDYVAAMLQKHLQVDAEKGEKITGLRDKVVNAYVDKFDGKNVKASDPMDAFDRAMRGI